MKVLVKAGNCVISLDTVCNPETVKLGLSAIGYILSGVDKDHFWVEFAKMMKEMSKQLIILSRKKWAGEL